MSLAIWANAIDVPGLVCSDARLTDKSAITWPWDRAISNKDQLYGQAGWDVGVNYRNFDDLLAKLKSLKLPGYMAGSGRPIRRGEISRLAIHAHGVSGAVFVNGRKNPPPLTADTVDSLHGKLHELGLMTPDDPSKPGVILFVGCLAGAGKTGSDLLIALSKVWPNRKIVAYSTLGYVAAAKMKRAGEACLEPGMRDTDARRVGEADDGASKWMDIKTWPWANETSPHAKIAFNQAIIRGGGI